MTFTTFVRYVFMFAMITMCKYDNTSFQYHILQNHPVFSFILFCIVAIVFVLIFSLTNFGYYVSNGTFQPNCLWVVIVQNVPDITRNTRVRWQIRLHNRLLTARFISLGSFTSVLGDRSEAVFAEKTSWLFVRFYDVKPGSVWMKDDIIIRGILLKCCPVALLRPLLIFSLNIFMSLKLLLFITR